MVDDCGEDRQGFAAEGCSNEVPEAGSEVSARRVCEASARVAEVSAELNRRLA